MFLVTSFLLLVLPCDSQIPSVCLLQKKTKTVLTSSIAHQEHKADNTGLQTHHHEKLAPLLPAHKQHKQLPPLSVAEECHALPLKHDAINSTVILVIGAGVLWWFFLPLSNSRNDVRALLAIGCYVLFQENLIFSSILIDSLTFARNLHAEAWFSGFLISVHKMGTSTGQLSFLVTLRMFPELWRKSLTVLGTGASLQIIGGLVFCMAGILSLAFTSLSLSRSLCMNLALCGRFLAGVGGGIQVALAWNQASHLLTGEQRALQNSRIVLAAALGLGAGPLLITAARSTGSLHDMGSAQLLAGSCEHVSMFPLAVALPLMQLAAIVQAPSVAKTACAATRATTAAVKNAPRQIAVVLLCLFMLVLRNLSVSALEAGMAMVMQTEYSASETIVGVATSFIVFSVLPGQAFYEAFRNSTTTKFWARSFLRIALLGSVMLFYEDPRMLLVACFIIFPAMTLSSGHIVGFGQDHALPNGYLLDLNTVTIVGNVLGDLVGRGGGPVFSRWGIALGGQDAFAIEQLGMVACSILLYEVALFLSPIEKADTEEEEEEEEVKPEAYLKPETAKADKMLSHE
eukprot:TRINITY_DN815_c0_g1_i1.p1 TRINITY_DN815_c0_g1~~TRINITY_DN815_c0_g1_i1.p1  ORF type:complete len:572 (+),score=79.64 TRINITY_DN815_c0_g1_i1:190-1905(+)